MMGLSDSERISMMRSAVLTQSMRVTDRRTDRLNWRGMYALQHYAVARKNAAPSQTMLLATVSVPTCLHCLNCTKFGQWGDREREKGKGGIREGGRE